MNFQNFRIATKPSILLLGEPGTGKTATAAMLGKPLILDLDGNISGAFTFLHSINATCKAEFITPHIGADGKLHPRKSRWAELNKALIAALNDKSLTEPFTTIVIDSASSLMDIMLDEVRRQQGRKIGDQENGIPDEPLQIQDWGAFKGLFREWIVRLKSLNRVLVFIAHVNVERDELTSVRQVFINVPGKFRDELAGLFSECWYASVDEVKTSGRPTTYLYTLKTRPNAMQKSLGLKSGIQLASTEPVDYAKLNSALFPST